jgi:MerR family transcriptional regulator, light-induced transcriptional regulator
MGVVVQRTGLSTHVLRAWERRYGAVRPGRTEGGQRLYSDADIERLRLLKRATAGGRPIGAVAALPAAELARLVGEDEAAEVPASGAIGVPEAALGECLSAAERLDGGALRAALMRTAVREGAEAVVSGMVVPLLRRVGDLWEQGSLRPAQEHVVSAAVRQVLDWLLSEVDTSSEGPLLVMGTPELELHEFGALLAAVTAADAGWRVLYLGPSLPASELAHAAERSGAWAVGVSVVVATDGSNARARRELGTLIEELPAGVPLLVGGRGSASVVPLGARHVTDLSELRGVLRSISVSGGDA